ncbi:MAG: GDSL-type esterase/lipase family protein [Pirellulaceae bacterium]|nr:GDSL-type esterase/lipase family protein [Pirellulaceae bacterium]
MSQRRSSFDQAPNAATGATPQKRRQLWKALLFRLAAVLLGLSPLIVTEVVLRALDLGRPTDFDDPFVGFSAVHPLFVLNPETGRREIPKSRQSHFRPESFNATKAPNEFRIFVLGGSTVQGRPWSIETSFTTWLELALAAADPSQKWEVVNCGGISYASYRLAPILEEVLRYEPDLVIFYEGNNEFLEDRTYEDIKHAPAALALPHRQVARLRTYSLLRGAVLRLSGGGSEASPAGRPVLADETDAMLDWRGGIAQYHRDADWQRDVTTHFETTLRRMVAMAESAKVPLLFVSPVTNLEWPPFKSEHRAGLSPAELERFDSLRTQASETIARDLPAALALFRQAAEIDGEFALVHYEIGTCLKELGQFEEARAAWLKARELDVCPLRMTAPLGEKLRLVATATGTPLLDADALLAARSRSGFADNQWLVDHVHPSIAGHQILATALVEQLAGMKVARPVADWEAAREVAFEQHLTSLDAAYFERGRTFLQAEQNWARGKATKERP